MKESAKLRAPRACEPNALEILRALYISMRRHALRALKILRILKSIVCSKLLCAQYLLYVLTFCVP